VTEFTHGGDVVNFAKKIGSNVEDIVDLSSNINFIKPKIDIDFNSLKIDSYPNYEEQICVIAKRYDVSSCNIELFNGASVAIDSLLRELATCRTEKVCTIYSPAYLEYKRVALKYGFKIEHINRFDDLDKEPSNGSIVIFVNPSTPDGRFYDIKPLLDLWKSKSCKVIVDESFLDFCNGDSATRYIDSFENLYIVKSLTKYYACAGVRVGVVVSNKDAIQKLSSTQPLWKISSFDSAYIISALKDNSFDKRSRLANITSKEYLTKILKSSPIVKKIYPTQANFILSQLKIEASKFQSYLVPYKIMVRDCSNFDFLDSYHIRVAVKDMRDLRVFAKALDDID